MHYLQMYGFYSGNGRGFAFASYCTSEFVGSIMIKILEIFIEILKIPRICMFPLLNANLHLLFQALITNIRFHRSFGAYNDFQD